MSIITCSCAKSFLYSKWNRIHQLMCFDIIFSHLINLLHEHWSRCYANPDYLVPKSYFRSVLHFTPLPIEEICKTSCFAYFFYHKCDYCYSVIIFQLLDPLLSLVDDIFKTRNLVHIYFWHATHDLKYRLAKDPSRASLRITMHSTVPLGSILGS